MGTKHTQMQQILDLAHKLGVIRIKDLKIRGIHHEPLRRLCEEGRMVKIGRGLYKLVGSDVFEFHSLVQVAKKVPEGVICLLSALAYHDIGTQMPFEVWLAIDRKARVPKLNFPKLRVLKFSDDAFRQGILEENIEGVTIRLYNPAKTIADCFKYRNKIGLDVALEALRDGLKQRKCTRDELWHYAKICRVTNVIRPYLEAMS